MAKRPREWFMMNRHREDGVGMVTLRRGCEFNDGYDWYKQAEADDDFEDDPGPDSTHGKIIYLQKSEVIEWLEELSRRWGDESRKQAHEKGNDSKIRIEATMAEYICHDLACALDPKRQILGPPVPSDLSKGESDD